jgi:hypothetical protein
MVAAATATDGDYTDDVTTFFRQSPEFVEDAKRIISTTGISDESATPLRDALVTVFMSAGVLSHPLVACVFARAMIYDVDWKKVLESLTTERT